MKVISDILQNTRLNISLGSYVNVLSARKSCRWASSICICSFRETLKCNLNVYNYVFIFITHWFVQLVEHRLKLALFYYYYEKTAFHSELHNFVFASIYQHCVHKWCTSVCTEPSWDQSVLCAFLFCTHPVLGGEDWLGIPHTTGSLLCHSSWSTDALWWTQS